MLTSTTTDDSFMPDSVQDEIASYVQKKIEETNPRMVVVRDDHGLDFRAYLWVSKLLTKRHAMPVAVLPGVAPNPKEGLHVEKYCKFIVKVVYDVAGAKDKIELFRFYKSADRSNSVLLQYMREPKASRSFWVQEVLDSIDLEGFRYNCVYANNTKIQLIVQQPLEVGKEYIVEGMIFDISKSKDNLDASFKQLMCLVGKVTNPEDGYRLTPQLIAKCRGRQMDWFIKSTTYPFDHCVTDLGLLYTLSIFHAYTGFPFNVMFVGAAGTGKTALLKKTQAITGEEIIDFSGSGKQLKGLVPSFYTANPDPGVLASATHKALLNEFFTAIDRIPDVERIHALSTLKGILEGVRTKVVSGVNSMVIQQRGDMLAASNPPKRLWKHGAYYQAILEMYQNAHYEPALLDRILFYFIPKEQEELVRRHVAAISQLVGNNCEKLPDLDYDTLGLLSPQELRAVVNFCKACSITMDVEAFSAAARSVESELPMGVFSRYFEFLRNMASAYAVIRSLSAGTLDVDKKQINIVDEDFRKAKAFLIHLIRLYSREDIKMGLRYRHEMGLSAAESALFSALASQFESPDKYAKQCRLEDLRKVVADSDFDECMQRLVDKGLVVRNEKAAQFVPELSAEALRVLFHISINDRLADEHKPIAIFLSKQGLTSWDDAKGWVSLWDVSKLVEGLQQPASQTFLELPPDDGTQPLQVTQFNRDGTKSIIMPGSLNDNLENLVDYFRQKEQQMGVTLEAMPTKDELLRMFSIGVLQKALTYGTISEVTPDHYKLNKMALTDWGEGK